MKSVDAHRLSYVDANPRRTLLRWAAGAGAGIWLAGCASKPVTTPVALQLSGAADMNPDGRGRASPLLVRVYALKSPGGFEGADFFSLFEKDTATLGESLVKREELILKPGEAQTLSFVLPADAKALGVLAAYRDLARAQWRQTHTFEPGKALRLGVVLGARGIGLQPI